MEDPNVSPHALGSVLSALAGWAALIFVGFVGSLFQPPDESYGFMFWAVVCAPFIFLVWLVALLPLYLCVPTRSILWRWPVCTLCGAAAGTLIASAVFFVLDPRGFIGRFPSFLAVSLYLGGTVGAVTCLFGSVTAPVLRGHYRLGPAPREAIRRLNGFTRWIKAKFSELAGQ
jgi:hypothetical protein